MFIKMEVRKVNVLEIFSLSVGIVVIKSLWDGWDRRRFGMFEFFVGRLLVFMGR